jgi:hypothetical protein
VKRRHALGALTAAALSVRPAEPRDYASAAEVLDEIERRSAEVGASLAAIVSAMPGARAFADSVRADHARQRAERDAIRRRMRLTPSATAEVAPPVTTLDALRALQQELVHAHAEGLPALDDEAAVRTLAAHMVDLSRHLTVIDLWIELHDAG